MTDFPVVIIGAGPAGLAAGMQLKRQGISALILERNRVGGLLWNANWVENYPGFPDGISGADMVGLFQKQADRLGVEIHQEEVVQTRYEGGAFRIDTNLRELTANYLVAATGTVARKMDSAVYKGNFEGRVFQEVYPLVSEKGKDILIIGAGDAAFDYGLNLSRHNQVKIFNKGSQIKALPLLWERVQETQAIQYFPETSLVSVNQKNSGRLEILAKNNDQILNTECDFLIVAIGRVPEYSFADQSIMKKSSRLLKDQKLFLIGDLQNGSFRQTSIAVGDGIRTAMIIGQILEKG